MAEVSVTRKKFDSAWPLVQEGIVNDFTNVLRQTCPVDTGRLKNSIKFRKVRKGWEIYMVGYALYVEFGTAPHIIRSKGKKALHWKKDSKHYFAKLVHHPGTRPQPFIRNALRAYLPKIISDNLVRHLR